MAAGDRDWGIIGVSLRSGDVAAQLGPQDGLYTVSTRSAVGTQLRLIGAVQKVLVAADDGQAVIDAIAAPTPHIVSFTLTEKGYLRRADRRSGERRVGQEGVRSCRSRWQPCP